jgi:hypothetical protein
MAETLPVDLLLRLLTAAVQRSNGFLQNGFDSD